MTMKGKKVIARMFKRAIKRYYFHFRESNGNTARSYFHHLTTMRKIITSATRDGEQGREMGGYGKEKEREREKERKSERGRREGERCEFQFSFE